jgi:hypothetical protein
MHMRQQVVAMLLCCCLALSGYSQSKLTPEDVIARHLESIGDAIARAAAKSRSVEGTATVMIVRGGQGGDSGLWKMTTDGSKFNLTMRFPNQVYPGENISADRTHVNIATVAATTRSQLGEFLYVCNEVLKEGLFGGTLSTAWPLLDLSAHQPEIRYIGLKKLDGRELHDIRYKPRKGESDLQIDLYFEPESSRHVMTIYSFHVLPNMARTTHPFGQIEGEYRLRESFAQFRPVNGLSLPTQWNLEMSWEGAGGWLQKWTFAAERFTPMSAVSATKSPGTSPDSRSFVH